MPASSSLSELLSTLFERQLRARFEQDARTIEELCGVVLSEKGELSGAQAAAAVFQKYRGLAPVEKLEFFRFLNNGFDLDRVRVTELAQAYAEDPSPENYAAFCDGAEAKRLALFRRLNQAPGATAELVRMRADLVEFLKEEPELKRLDRDFVHLLRSWFNRGFLVLRQITWETPASILEKVIEYEAVHEIHTWDDLRRRLQPADRRCFAFFHPSMPDEPLIFVEIALITGVPGSVQALLSDTRTAINEAEADTAVFYSISNCQKGLAGISFGNSLIKQVARDLARDLPNLKTFVTLSPLPGFARWLDKAGKGDAEFDGPALKQLAAHYLADQKRADGRPLDPVARFHLSNGAQIHAVHAEADTSENGITQSRGVMVNYHYDLKRISKNLQLFAETGNVVASSAIRTLAKQAAKLLAD